jgi:hypothetical protein
MAASASFSSDAARHSHAHVPTHETLCMCSSRVSGAVIEYREGPHAPSFFQFSRSGEEYTLMPITSTRFRAGLHGQHASGAGTRCQRGWEWQQTTGAGAPVRAHGLGLARLVLAKPAATPQAAAQVQLPTAPRFCQFVRISSVSGFATPTSTMFARLFRACPARVAQARQQDVPATGQHSPVEQPLMLQHAAAVCLPRTSDCQRGFASVCCARGDAHLHSCSRAGRTPESSRRPYPARAPRSQ